MALRKSTKYNRLCRKNKSWQGKKATKAPVSNQLEKTPVPQTFFIQFPPLLKYLLSLPSLSKVKGKALKGTYYLGKKVKNRRVWTGSRSPSNLSSKNLDE